MRNLQLGHLLYSLDDPYADCSVKCNQNNGRHTHIRKLYSLFPTGDGPATWRGPLMEHMRCMQAVGGPCGVVELLLVGDSHTIHYNNAELR